MTVAYYFDHLATADDVEVVVEEEDFVAAYRELVPSVSAKELEHYDRVRQTFERGEEKGEQGLVDRSEKSSIVEQLENMRIGQSNGVNGSAKANGHAGGKGKGKAPATGFGSAEDGDEDLY